VQTPDQQLLRTRGARNFHKVQPDSRLPFDDGFFDLVFHQDVIEHTERPYSFMREQYRVLRGGVGTVIVGTPNLLRSMNCLKALIGKLHFPVIIGRNEEISDYVHVQEFHTTQLKLLLEETGFVDVTLHHVYFGFSMSNICFSLFPTGSIGKTFAHFIMAKGVKV
jgi:ubiquinone/menaquinone biosynthesis C-methylase UbiE